MKKIFLLIIIASLISCKEAGEKDDRFYYNYSARILEKYQDTEYHLRCEDLENPSKTLIWDFKDEYHPEETEKRYDNYQVGDTVFFDFISKHHFSDY